MEALLASLYYFFERFTSINPASGIFIVLLVILVASIYIFLRKGLQGWQRQEITVGNTAHGIVTYHGTAARRVSSYFIFIGVFLLIVVLNEFTFQIGFSVAPFRVYMAKECVWRCIGVYKF